MIPKRMFFYWSGNNLSWMRYMTLYSFRKFNPDWEIVLYLSDNNNTVKTWNSPEEQDFINYKGINYLDKITELNIKIEKVIFLDPNNSKYVGLSPVHESDLFRYYQLYTNGGFYCDMDVLFFRPIDEFYNYVTQNNFDTIVYQCSNYMAIGFLGALQKWMSDPRADIRGLADKQLKEILKKEGKSDKDMPEPIYEDTPSMAEAEA